MMASPKSLLIFWICLLASHAYGQSETSAPRVENKALRIDFDPIQGGLKQFSDLSSGHKFLENVTPFSLWHIDLMDGLELEPNKAHVFSSTKEGNTSLTLTWSDFGIVAAPKLQVVVHVTLDDLEAVSRWQITVSGLQKSFVKLLSFPRIGQIAPQENETLAVPQWLGQATDRARLITNPAKGKVGRCAFDYPGYLSMQFLTFYSEKGSGLLLSTDDTHLLRKQFAAFGDGNGNLALEVVHTAPVEHAAQQQYSPQYNVLIRPFSGDWFTAAEFYRRWAQHQWWATESRLRQGLIPKWVRETALWVWNRGTSADVLSQAAVLQKQAAMPVSVLWHWWHGCAYDVGFPEYLPPREGATPFREAIARAEAKDIHALLYMNQRLWGMTTQSWTERGAARYAVKSPDGNIRPEVYNTFVKAPCASMCIGTPFWRNTYAELAEKAIRNLNAAGIYMDQACSSMACYDPNHGHPLGGGTYWMEGFRALQSDIRTRTKDVKKVALAGEGCGEGWLPYLDLMLSLQVSIERYAAPDMWEPIPLFNAVYHDCAIQFGNYSSLTRPPYDELWPKEYAPTQPLALLDQKFASQFRLEQARSFVWGQQPTIANFREKQLYERSGEIEYFLQIARLRMHSLKYLRDGVFLRPPKLNAPHEQIPVSRLSIYAGQQKAVKEYSKTFPLVLATAWSAKDGGLAIALANIADKKIPLHVMLDQLSHPVPATGTVFRLTEQGRTKIAVFKNGTIDLSVEMDPCDARIYEIVAD